jgi:broad-specificity NMP kinase
MPLHFITGVAGSGKSSVRIEIEKLGHEAHDTDGRGFARWRDNITGYIYPKSSVKPEQRTPEFIENNSWVVPRENVEELAQSIGERTVFLCGDISNFDELGDLFSSVFLLMTSPETIEHRLKTRVDNNWGKQPHELAYTLAKLKESEKAYAHYNPIIVNAGQPLHTVAQDIVKGL